MSWPFGNGTKKAKQDQGEKRDVLPEYEKSYDPYAASSSEDPFRAGQDFGSFSDNQLASGEVTEDTTSIAFDADNEQDSLGDSRSLEPPRPRRQTLSPSSSSSSSSPPQLSPSPRVLTKEEMQQVLRTQVGPYTSCAITGVASFIRGGQLGMGFGFVMGAYEGFQLGLWREPHRLASLLGGKSFGQGITFATYLGSYAGVKCFTAAARGGVDDALNAGVGGAVAGSLGALRTRNPQAIIGASVMGGAMMMVIEGVMGGGNQPSPVPQQAQ